MLKAMEELMNTKVVWIKVQQMYEYHSMEQEVEECAKIGVKVKEVVDQVKIKFDDFKTKLNAPVSSS